MTNQVQATNSEHELETHKRKHAIIYQFTLRSKLNTLPRH